MIDSTAPVVRPVHRIRLATDGHGQITARDMMDLAPLPAGATVVLECGEGWWIRPEGIEYIRRALSCVGHISITGIHQQRRGGKGEFGIVYGLDAIADQLRAALAAPPLPHAV